MPIRHDAQGRFASGGSTAPGGKRGGRIGRKLTAHTERVRASDKQRIKAAGPFPAGGRSKKAKAAVESHIAATRPGKTQERAAHPNLSAQHKVVRAQNSGTTKDRRAAANGGAVGPNNPIRSTAGKRKIEVKRTTSETAPRKPRSAISDKNHQSDPLVRAGSGGARRTADRLGRQTATRAKTNVEDRGFRAEAKGKSSNAARKRLVKIKHAKGR